MKYALFISHRSGEHGLSMHSDINSLESDLNDVVEAIAEGEISQAINSDKKTVQQTINRLKNYRGKEQVGSILYEEFSDSTWFDIFIV